MKIWHAIRYTTARVAELEHTTFEAGVDAFFPLRWERVQVGKHRYWQVTPWLGIYAFVRLDHEPGNPQVLDDQMAAVKGLRGIIDFLVDRSGVPYRSSDAEIALLRDDTLRFRRDQDLPPSRRFLGPMIPSDTPVRIVKGPFEGCLGHYFKALGHGKATVCIPLFGQETAVDIADTDFVVDAQAKERAA